MKLTRRALLGKLPFGIAGVIAAIRGYRPQEKAKEDDWLQILKGPIYRINGHDYSPEDMKAITGGDWWDPVDGKHATGLLTLDELYPIGTIAFAGYGGNLPVLSGWVWADGLNGTRDMRSRFLDSHGNEICGGCNIIQRIA